MTIYHDYTKDRIGWFFGLTGAQATTLALTVAPVLWAIQAKAWATAGLLLPAALVVAVLTVVPVRGRSAAGWLTASTRYALGAVTGWSRFTCKAAHGKVTDLTHVDLPGVLAGLQVHDGPELGPHRLRVALIQDHAAGTWAVTAALVHPGVGMTDTDGRDRLGAGLAGLLDLAATTGLIEQVLLLVRTVPEDGAERDLWVTRHRRPGSPDLARRVNDDLLTGLSRASVRTEAFVTLVIPEARLGRPAKEAGGGLTGRATLLYGLMAEFEAHLLGPVGATSVEWLTSAQLALACRTGFAPGDRAGIITALAHTTPTAQGPAGGVAAGVNGQVPWALAGPSGAEVLVRHYSHDAWNSISATLSLPTRGAAIGALAPVLTPSEPGERRCLLVAYPVLRAVAAGRRTANREFAADVSAHLRARAGVRTRATQRTEAAKAHGMDDKLARGNAMLRPYAVATVTVPKTLPVNDFGRRLDASIRRAGFAPIRLDLAQDVAFAASTVPLGVGLTRSTT